MLPIFIGIATIWMIPVFFILLFYFLLALIACLRVCKVFFFELPLSGWIVAWSFLVYGRHWKEVLEVQSQMAIYKKVFPNDEVRR